MKHNRILQTVPDAMHTVKDVIEKLILQVELHNRAFLNNINSTGKSDYKVVRAEGDRFKSSEPPWQLTRDDLKTAEERVTFVCACISRRCLSICIFSPITPKIS